MILVLRTDKPEADIGLFDGDKRLAYKTWPAHRQLAETIHHKIAEILSFQGSTLKEVEGVVVYIGPGSFTGLRIGISVANALAYSLGIPIAGATGEAWIQAGLKAMTENSSMQPIIPEYGQLPHITQQKK